ncbi:MAG: glutamate racemase [Burkholderiales bacterium]|nr:glutamate racemase [Burkholderiales bacterium]
MCPIGVFDSGVGGLSVLRALLQELPHEQFVYVADSGYAPYGERNDDFVLQRSHAIADWLIAQHHIKALVVACNTATAAAIRVLRTTCPELPIIGIEPALKPAAHVSKTGVIGVMATRGTLNSEKFRNLLESLHGRATFVLQPCDGLADAIERADAIETEALCAQYTRAMGQFGSKDGEMDTLVLGCTHYPFSAKVLADQIGPNIPLLEGGLPVARQTRRLLAEQHALLEEMTTNQPLLFYTTGHPDALKEAVQRWLHLETDVASVQMNQ